MATHSDPESLLFPLEATSRHPLGQESGAGNPLVRIRGGGRRKASPLDSNSSNAPQLMWNDFLVLTVDCDVNRGFAGSLNSSGPSSASRAHDVRSFRRTHGLQVVGHKGVRGLRARSRRGNGDWAPRAPSDLTPYLRFHRRSCARSLERDGGAGRVVRMRSVLPVGDQMHAAV